MSQRVWKRAWDTAVDDVRTAVRRACWRASPSPRRASLDGRAVSGWALVVAAPAGSLPSCWCTKHADSWPDRLDAATDAPSPPACGNCSRFWMPWCATKHTGDNTPCSLDKQHSCLTRQASGEIEGEPFREPTLTRRCTRGRARGSNRTSGRYFARSARQRCEL